MSWKCELLNVVGTFLQEYKPPKENGLCGETLLVDDKGNKHHLKDLPIGTMFYVPKDCDYNEWPWYLAKPDKLSDYYKQNNFNRQPLFVILPKQTLFVIDGKCWKDGVSYGGWAVKGEAPNINVSPSINIGGIYHGFLSGGYVGNDVEGRKFE